MVFKKFASFVALSLLALFILASPRALALGVNWGTSASHPLPPAKVVELLKANNISKVKLFDTDSDVLQALSGSKILVTVGIPNSMLHSLNTSSKAAESWVHDNLTRYLSDGTGGVRIETPLPNCPVLLILCQLPASWSSIMLTFQVSKL